MGASESKLDFKQGIFRLANPNTIRPDEDYWSKFWRLPENAEDIFTLFSPMDIRRVRDNALPNLETLILSTAAQLCELRKNPAFPNIDQGQDRHALNCVRILTRVLPFVYESDILESWERRIFWFPRPKPTRSGSDVLFEGAGGEEITEGEAGTIRPLGEELVDVLVDLLFFSDFTLPTAPPGKSKISYAIWQTGVGCHTPVSSSKVFESNRTEILRLLLVICGKALYMPANVLPVKGVPALTYLATCSDKQIVLSLLCSLLNTTLKYNPASWRVPYDHVVFRDEKQLLAMYCLQFLLVLILYPIPESTPGVTPRNYFRHFLGRLHRVQDFQFLVDGMTRILNQPLLANSSYLPGSQKSLSWAPEMIMLFWETLQCNKRFRSFIIDTDRAHDFLILALFYALDNKNDPSKQGLIRMCVFVLQTMSVEANFGKSLNKRFEAQNTLPQSIRIANFHGSYADYLIHSVYSLLNIGQGRLEAIYPALLAILNNIAPHLENIARATSSKIIQLFTSMASPAFLLANETNHDLLKALLEAMNAIIEHQYSKNPVFVYAVFKSKNRFLALREFTLEGGQNELEKQALLRKEQQESTTQNNIRPTSADGMRSPIGLQSPNLTNVPEEQSAFAIGDDSDEESSAPARAPLTPVESSRASISSSVPDMANAEEALPTQLRGMSEKARGKMPAGQSSFSRVNSISSVQSWSHTWTRDGQFQPSPDWIESWQPELPLHTILSLIEDLKTQVPSTGSEDGQTILNAIRKATIHGIEPSPIRLHLFEWSPLSLGWYESLLWGFIFSSEILVSKGTAGIWNSTLVKLFRVQEVAAQTPSLLAPRGAVDAVGSNLVSRIGSLGFTSSPRPGSGNGTGVGVSPNVRDV